MFSREQSNQEKGITFYKAACSLPSPFRHPFAPFAPLSHQPVAMKLHFTRPSFSAPCVFDRRWLSGEFQSHQENAAHLPLLTHFSCHSDPQRMLWVDISVLQACCVCPALDSVQCWKHKPSIQCLSFIALSIQTTSKEDEQLFFTKADLIL